MDNIKDIALSKIADVLSCNELILREKYIWQKILLNSGLHELYEEYKFQIIMEEKSEGYEIYFTQNNRCYPALIEIFNNIRDDNKLLVNFLNSIVEKFNIHYIFDEEIGNKIVRSNRRNVDDFDITDYLKKLSVVDKNNLINNFGSISFNIFRSNINILGYDVNIDEYNQLKIMPYTFTNQKSKDVSLISQWLLNDYPNVFESYEDAIKSYGLGDNVACLTHCRNIITGIFSINKEEQTKWLMGLHKCCSKDKNIANLKPSEIPDTKYNAHSSKVNNRYQYPRFNTIYQLYSYLSDLGPHIREGNKVEDKVDCEEVDSSDALLGLRMTEDVLIWLYKNDF